MLPRDQKLKSMLWILVFVSAVPYCDAGLRFDGKQSEVTIPRLRYLGKNPLTIEFVVTPDAGNKFSRLISNEFYKNSKTNGFGIGLRDGHWMVYVETERGGRRLISQRPIIEGKRVHLAVVFEDKKIRLFVNGRPDPKSLELTHPHIPSENDFLLGTKFIQPGRQGFWFSGEIEAFRFSQTARYRKEFTPPEKFEADSETLVLYQFDETEGEVCHDRSGFSFDGTTTNTKWVPVHADRIYDDVSQLDPYVGTYQVDRSIRGGGKIAASFFELNAKKEIWEDKKRIGTWDSKEKGKLLLQLSSDSDAEISLDLQKDDRYLGSQSVAGKKLEWNLTPIRIDQIWTQANVKDKNTRTITLYSNGTFDDYQGKGVWKLERRNLTLKWPRGWINELTLSSDKQSYTGIASPDIKLEGVRLD
jgi:Concanavalin A-like lectin/glucanases superfamily